jgi:predicted RNase H-like HicB family nuclease
MSRTRRSEPFPYRYRVVWSAEDAGFVATCAELPEASGFGRTPERAMAELRTALELFAEDAATRGSPMPQALAASEASGQFRLRLPRAQHAELARRAEEEGVSLNTCVVALLARALGEEAAWDGARVRFEAALVTSAPLAVTTGAGSSLPPARDASPLSNLATVNWSGVCPS